MAALLAQESSVSSTCAATLLTWAGALLVSISDSTGSAVGGLGVIFMD